jgi:hypothetical protein
VEESGHITSARDLRHADQFAFDHGGRGDQERLAPGIGLGQDMVPVTEVHI